MIFKSVSKWAIAPSEKLEKFRIIFFTAENSSSGPSAHRPDLYFAIDSLQYGNELQITCSTTHAYIKVQSTSSNDASGAKSIVEYEIIEC